MGTDVAHDFAANDGPQDGDRAPLRVPAEGDTADFLAHATAMLAAAGGYRRMLSVVARLAVPQYADWCAVHVRGPDGSLGQLATTHRDPIKAQALRDADRQLALRLADDSVVARVLRTGRSELLRSVTAHDAPFADAPVWTAALRAAGLRSMLAAPLTYREGEPGGRGHADAAPQTPHDDARPAARPRPADAVLIWAVGESGRSYDERDLVLAGQVALVASAAVRSVVRLEAVEQRHADAEAARQQVTAALETMADGLVTVDRKWRVTYLNPAAARLWRKPRESVLGRSVWDIFPEAVGTPLFTESQRAMELGTSVEYESFFAPLGASLNVRAFPAADGLSIHLRDVTERRRAEQDRERLLAEAQVARGVAEDANRAKADFLASMSHELRTPLNAILGYVSLLADGITGPVNEAQTRQLGRVGTSARHLLTLIEEILSFARLEAGSQQVRVEPTDLHSVVRGAAQLIEPVIETQGLRFRVEAAGAHVVVRTDARMVRQILLNLLANAARFTPPGGDVSLTARVHDGAAWLEVRDTGIGIAPENHDRIFEPFWQVEQGKSRRVGGTGLGLTVSRQLARLLGGDITVTSAARVGSTFTVRLPIDSLGLPGAGGDSP
jgi:PAS domain S-box-containing protein